MVTDKNDDEERRKNESLLEELADYFIAKADESELPKTAEFSEDAGNLPYNVNYYTYIVYTSQLGNIAVTLDRDYTFDLEHIVASSIKENQVKEGKVNDALLQERNIKRKLKNLALDFFPEPHLYNIGVSIKIIPKTILKVEEGEYPEPLHSIFELTEPQTYYDNDGSFNAKKWEDYKRVWEEIYMPVIERYGNRIAGIALSQEETSTLMKKVIDLGFEMCKDEELDKSLEKAINSYYLQLIF